MNLNELYSLMKNPPDLKTWQRFCKFLDAQLNWFECWEWNGARTKKGYGVFGINQRAFHAHRTLCIWLYGNLPVSLVVDHVVCNNRPCSNPLHLIPTTVLDNTLRPSSNAPSAIASRRTHCDKGHEFSPSNTAYLNKRKPRQRFCLTCYHARYTKLSSTK